MFNRRFLFPLEETPATLPKASLSLDVSFQLEDHPDPLLEFQVPLSLLPAFRQVPFKVELAPPPTSPVQGYPSFFFFSVTLFDFDLVQTGDYFLSVRVPSLILEPLPFHRTNYLLLLSSSIQKKVFSLSGSEV